MTGAQVRSLIERVGQGATMSAKVEDVRARSGISIRTLRRYMADGIPGRAPGAIINALEGLKKEGESTCAN